MFFIQVGYFVDVLMDTLFYFALFLSISFPNLSTISTAIFGKSLMSVSA